MDTGKEVALISREVFLTLFDYNYWARDRQLEACASLTEEEFRRPLGSSFTSVQATLAHMVEAEWVWSERWYGRSTTKQQTDRFASQGLSTRQSIKERWRPVEDSVRSYITGLQAERLKQELRYTNQEGKRWVYPLWQALFHLINHQTYHRGQVTTLLRQLGATPPQIDYLVAHDLKFRL